MQTVQCIFSNAYVCTNIHKHATTFDEKGGYELKKATRVYERIGGREVYDDII